MVQIQKNLQNLGRRFLPAAWNATWVSIGLVCGVLVACILLMAAGIAAAVIADRLTPITYSTQVRVADGEVRGRERITPDGSVFLSFQGIPYAKPPLEELRFKAPRPVEPWDGVLDALSEGNICPQPHKVSKTSPIKSMGSMLKMVLSMPGMAKFMFNYIARISEDCLYLNVYTPKPKSEQPAERLKPVVFFVHGGGFIAGNGDTSLYGPDYLMQLDVVVVTFNYRLGAIGFLATGTPDAPGNAGLKDQAAALRWVRRNIRAFGGDPDKVTLYGESAGSASVALHLMSPMSSGLFHRAIMSSSTAQNQYVMTADYERFSRSLALECGADNATADDPRTRVEFLREQSHTHINDRLTEVLGEEDVRSIMGRVPFSPVVEKEFPGEEAFLLEHPDVLMREGRYAPVPVIIGSNSKEGSIFYTGVTRPPTEEGFRMIDEDMTCTVPDPLYQRLDPEQSQELAGKVRQLYFDGGHVDEDSAGALIDLFGDLQLLHGIHVSSKWFTHFSQPASPVYLYHFTFSAKSGLSFFFSSKNLKVQDALDAGAGHGEELSYVFRHHLFKGHSALKQTSREQRVRDKMTKLFTNFIKTGNPTPSNASLSRLPVASDVQDVGVAWPPSRPGREVYLEIGEELAVKRHLLAERMAFWDRTFKNVTQSPLYDFVE
ncbi:juvenile hormone esterase-like isoform X2 [Thrips palmi]|uniref:Carboxylic ester hydrolase n=1 Tax=Thrips palmi TaxID=161013 RepID=A0A6P8ZZ80_THRPL|nr:juvenile hormone esterase-like isoform X2 [Thrips palmi]